MASIQSNVSQSRITRDTQQIYQRWGSGIDGSINITTTTTLTGDVLYENLNIATGVTLNSNGYIIRVRNTLRHFGTISNSATGATPGARGTVGGGGAVGVSTLDLALGGNGGQSTVTPPDAGVNAILRDKNVDKPRILDLVNNASTFAGGSGSSGSNSFGAGGGVVLIFANTVTGNGSITANGANAGTNLHAGGGGAVLVYSTSPQGSITLSAAGGTTSGTGIPGGNGNTSWLQV